ncbi:Protein THEMIS2 [Varanus komodoensis]|nr:Protein THEMIS2 [Varanus komodoensis]
MDSVSFHNYICDLDHNSLPRVVKICSGVYFQGSVYELWGNECCLSTGDLMKIVDVQLQNVICQNVEGEDRFELPPDFKEPPCAKQRKTFLPRHPSSKDRLQQKLYTMNEILQSATMRRKRLKCAELGRSQFQLCPLYKVKVIMHFRNDVVKIDSALDVEVVDVTEESQNVHFIKPLMLSEILEMESLLPMEAELLEGPKGLPVFQSSWASYLRKGCRIHIHRKTASRKILASSSKGKSGTCHFLISSHCKGLFRRRPRKFSSTSELALSLATGKTLQVVVTRDYENGDGEFPLFSVGDRLEVLSLERAGDLSARDVLVCWRDNGDEDKEQICVPLFLDAGFVEDVRDSRRYSLDEAIEDFQLPCEVKVMASDCVPNLLSSCSVLTLEAQVHAPFLTASLAEEPHLAFEIPPRWMDMSVFLTMNPMKPAPCSSIPSVEELTEAFYYNLLKELPSNTPAPPRPPKRGESRLNKCPQKTPEGKSSAEVFKPLLSGNSRQVSQNPADQLSPGPEKISKGWGIRRNPNQYSINYELQWRQQPTKQVTDTSSSNDPDHDYEEVDKIEKIACKMQRAAIKH